MRSSLSVLVLVVIPGLAAGARGDMLYSGAAPPPAAPDSGQWLKVQLGYSGGRPWHAQAVLTPTTQSALWGYYAVAHDNNGDAFWSSTANGTVYLDLVGYVPPARWLKVPLAIPAEAGSDPLTVIFGAFTKTGPGEHGQVAAVVNGQATALAAILEPEPATLALAVLWLPLLVRRRR